MSKKYERESTEVVEPIAEYTKENIEAAIESTKGYYKMYLGVNEFGSSGATVIEAQKKAVLYKMRHDSLRSVLALHEELGLPYALLDTLEYHEHTLVHLLLNSWEEQVKKDAILRYIHAKPEARYQVLLEYIARSKNLEVRVDEREEAQERQRQYEAGAADRHEQARKYNF